MPTPSLLIVPARFKTGKLYSQIPTSGAGDFTVTRNTTATRFTSAGLLESVASGIPRLDYFASGGVTGCPALLVEPAATNLALQSTFSTGWNTSFSGSVSGNASGTNSPEGSGNAALLSVVTTANSSIFRAITTVSGSVYTASVFAKKRDKNFLYFVNLAGNTAIAWFNLASGTVGTVGANTTARIENYGNGWYRCSITQTVGGTTSYIQFGLSDADNTNAAASSGSNFVFGAQFELSSVPTSYIPTTAGTGSRSADAIRVSGAVSGSIGQTEGTIYAEVDLKVFPVAGSPIIGIISLNVGAANLQNCIILGIERLIAGTNRFYSFVQRANATQAGIIGPSISAGVFKVAFAYKENDFTMYVNGVQTGTPDTSGLLPSGTLNEVLIGTRFTGDTQFLNDRIRAAALYTTRLTNAQLAALTT